MVTVDLYPDEVYNLVSEIPDPEIPVITIKDLGILRGVRIEDGEYIVTITPTYTACPAMDAIAMSIKLELLQVGFSKVTVNLILNP